jgi:psiF repeat
MKVFTYLLGFGLAFALSVVHAEDEKPKKPNRMATCNKNAEGKKGQERKDFMKECLSTKKPS